MKQLNTNLFPPNVKHYKNNNIYLYERLFKYIINNGMYY